MPEPLTIQLRSLTPLWTGGVDQTCDRLHETGLIGSLRWWYEALVRGLGGYACDPNDDDRCPDKNGKHCVVCELFGCTGWSRKFRLRVVDHSGASIISCLQKEGIAFALTFLELRTWVSVEKWLVTEAVRICAHHASMGGRTTRKPQRKEEIGKDYGLVSIISEQKINSSQQAAQEHIRTFAPGKQCAPDWPDLRWFFFIEGKSLSRLQINDLVGLSADGRSEVGNEDFQKFLRGQRGTQDQNAVSKKVFSFRSKGGRVWGYARDAVMRDRIAAELRKQLANVRIKTGEEVIREL